MTNQEVKNIINRYSYTYDNKYWNEGLIESQLSEINWGVTDSGCSRDNCTSNRFGNAWQCYGYSLFIAYLISGHKLLYGNIENAANGTALAGGWTIYKSNLTSLTLEPGDIIRTGTSGSSGHSAVVCTVNSDGTFSVTQCLGDEGCQLKWGNFNRNSANAAVSTVLAAARYVIKAPKTYNIRNVGSGKYLTVMDSSAVSGGRVVQLNSTAAEIKRKWIAFPTENNGHIISTLADSSANSASYEIKYTSNSDNYARIYEKSTSGSVVTIETSGSYHKIKTTKSGADYYLAADASGSNVYWTSGDSTAYQKWSFEEV